MIRRRRRTRRYGIRPAVEFLHKPAVEFLHKKDDLTTIKVSKLDLIRPRDAHLVMEATKFFFQCLINLQRFCIQNPEEKVEVKVRKKNARKLTLSLLGEILLKTTKMASMTIPMSKIEIMLLFEAMIKAKVVSPIKQVPTGFLDADFHISRYGWRGEQADCFRENGQVRRLSSRFGVHCGAPRLFLCVQAFTSGEVLVLFAPKKKIVQAQEWFEKMRYLYSPFRGRISLVGRDGFGFSDDAKKVGWTDLIPNKEIQDEYDVIEQSFKAPDEYATNGLQVKRGLLLYGPAGVGKTLHVECFITMALQQKIAVFIVRGLKHMGDLTHVYQTAQGIGPSLVILEDVDTIAISREETGYGNGILQELLNILDGTESISKVVTIATTNVKGMIDRALAARPGRFDRAIEIGYPSAGERRKVFELHAKAFGLKIDFKKAFATPEGKSLLHKTGVTHAHMKNVAETIVRKLRQSNASEIELFKLAAKQQDVIVLPDQKYVQTEGMGFGSAKDEDNYDGEEDFLTL